MTAIASAVTPDRIASAIAAIEQSRQTHVLWVEWYQRQASCQSATCDHIALDTRLVGDSDFHQACIERYDGVIATLRDVGHLLDR